MNMLNNFLNDFSLTWFLIGWLVTLLFFTRKDSATYKRLWLEQIDKTAELRKQLEEK